MTRPRWRRSASAPRWARAPQPPRRRRRTWSFAGRLAGPAFGGHRDRPWQAPQRVIAGTGLSAAGMIAAAFGHPTLVEGALLRARSMLRSISPRCARSGSRRRARRGLRRCARLGSRRRRAGDCAAGRHSSESGRRACGAPYGPGGHGRAGDGVTDAVALRDMQRWLGRVWPGSSPERWRWRKGCVSALRRKTMLRSRDLNGRVGASPPPRNPHRWCNGMAVVNFSSSIEIEEFTWLKSNRPIMDL